MIFRRWSGQVGLKKCYFEGWTGELRAESGK